MTTAISGTGVTFADSSVQTTAPQQYAKNKIINGKMDIAQRGTSFAGLGAVASYTLDRYRWASSSAAVVTASQQTDVPSSNEFQNSLRVAVTTADASVAAGDLSGIDHFIEGYNARDLIGKTFTLSFWVRSSKTGIHCIGLQNSGLDRSYVGEYNINAANTWEQKTITVTGGLITAGTWDWTTGRGLVIKFALAAGSTYQTTAGAWQTGNFLSTSNQVNCLDTIGNIFAITGVQLEVGAVATSFEHRPYGAELALCQRYYYRITPAENETFGQGLVRSTTTVWGFVYFPTTMRIKPTALEQSGTAGDYDLIYGTTTASCSAVPALTSGLLGGDALHAVVTFTVSSGLTVGQIAQVYRGAGGNAYLGFSAEL